MIPLRDENPTRTTPWVLYGLILTNVVVFIYYSVNSPGNRLTGFELIPYEITTGKLIGPAPLGIWATIFTSMFLHANLLHIGGNMLYLWIFGNNIEDVLGHFRFLAFYFVSGIGAAALQIWSDPLSKIPMIGASGAIAGVLAAYLYLFPRARVTVLIFLFIFVQYVVLPAYIVLGFWIILQALNWLMSAGSTAGSNGGVAFAAHIGGFSTGMILTLLMGGRKLLQGRRSVEYHQPRGWMD